MPDRTCIASVHHLLKQKPDPCTATDCDRLHPGAHCIPVRPYFSMAPLLLSLWLRFFCLCSAAFSVPPLSLSLSLSFALTLASVFLTLTVPEQQQFLDAVLAWWGEGAQWTQKHKKARAKSCVPVIPVELDGAVVEEQIGVFGTSGWWQQEVATRHGDCHCTLR